LLGILLGMFGAHRFYLGYTAVGVVMLMITLCTCGIGTIITAPWGIIEGILCLTGSMTDADGRQLTD
jgi:TM2 domain-containing membrane protein YozV